ncbi:MAG TPA: patatin-like phospholipase family protein [Polyangiaceae bacterium]|nr:patatin-like phospholipase family protein [Polyangiaceae bacterium]
MSKSKKRALVLGCGGVAGAAWQIATLAELERALGWDAREADVLVGTSAGAVLAALLGAGVSVERMVRSQLGELANDCWNHDEDTGGPRPPKPALGLTAPALMYGALRRRLHPFAGLAGLLPRGTADIEPLMRLVDNVVPAGQWSPHPATWIMVIDAKTGERVALGREGAPRVALNVAVGASFAIPGWYRPMRTNGATYLDGGIVSPTSADLLVGTDVREAIVLAPMAARELDPQRRKGSRFAAELRRYMTNIVNREVRALEQAGIRVVRLEPGAEDRAAIGSNMMNPKRRRRVFDTATRTAKDAVADALLGFGEADRARDATGGATRAASAG